jgi:nicotinamidase-related amidase
MESARVARVPIDYQRGFRDPRWGARNNPGAEDNALRLIAAFRAAGLPIFHIRHLSQTPGSPLNGPGAVFLPGFAPQDGEPLIEKAVNSVFIGTDLEARLRGAEIGRLVICGLTTPHCVSIKTRMAANLGFEVLLAEDACAAFENNADTSFDGGLAFSAEEIHRAARARLHGEFATVVRTVDIIAMLDNPSRG